MRQVQVVCSRLSECDSPFEGRGGGGGCVHLLWQAVIDPNLETRKWQAAPGKSSGYRMGLRLYITDC